MRGARSARGQTGQVRIKRVALTCAMVLVTLNVWTGSPLFALWVGSRVQGTGPPSMLAIAVAAATLGATSFVLVKLLARLDTTYARVSGRASTVRRHVPWLRSMRGERPEYELKRANELSPLEIILISMVVLVVALFEVWFFFYSPSPIDQRSGRSHKAPLIGGSTPIWPAIGVQRPAGSASPTRSAADS
jgi:hypothetical protein